MDVKLIAPIAMEEGLRFAIREGGHTVGAGVVSKAAVRFWWQGQKESNPQPTVLETVALPIELYP